MATGASEVVLVNPINFVKFRMQRPEWGYSGMLDAIQTIYRVEGLPAFWKGAGAVFVRNTICNGGMVGGYKFLSLSANFCEHFSSKPWEGDASSNCYFESDLSILGMSTMLLLVNSNLNC